MMSLGAKRSLVALALVLAQTIALSPAVVLAADGAVRVAGHTVFVNRASAGGMSADQRSEVIQRNLDNALVASSDRSPSSVKIMYVKGMPVITLGGYQVVTVDANNARMAGTTPAILAQRWAGMLKSSLADSASIDSYVAQLSGADVPSGPPVAYGAPAAPAGTPTAIPAQYSGSTTYGSSPAYQQGRVVYAPAGLTLPVSLSTSISTQVARPGDMIQAEVNQSVDLGGGVTIPQGSTLMGQVTNSKAGGFMGRSGLLTVKFTRLRTPTGEVPISAHIVGGIGKYTQIGGEESGTMRGEGMTAKFGQAAIRGAVGAGLGAGLGTAIGAIAGRSGRATGRGAWSGAAIGGGAGVAQSVFLRKGRDVVISSGTPMQVQLDAPVTISGGGVPPYTGAF